MLSSLLASSGARLPGRAGNHVETDISKCRRNNLPTSVMPVLAGIADRMHVATDGVGNFTTDRSRLNVRRQKRRIGIGLIQVVDDRQGLSQFQFLIDPVGNQACGIYRSERFAVLVTPSKMDIPVAQIDPFEVGGDPHPVCGGRAEIAVQNWRYIIVHDGLPH